MTDNVIPIRPPPTAFELWAEVRELADRIAVLRRRLNYEVVDVQTSVHGHREMDEAVEGLRAWARGIGPAWVVSLEEYLSEVGAA